MMRGNQWLLTTCATASPLYCSDPPSYNVANVKAEAPKKKGKVVKKKK
jgi:hypothetical protein